MKFTRLPRGNRSGGKTTDRDGLREYYVSVVGKDYTRNGDINCLLNDVQEDTCFYARAAGLMRTEHCTRCREDATGGSARSIQSQLRKNQLWKNHLRKKLRKTSAILRHRAPRRSQQLEQERDLWFRAKSVPIKASAYRLT